MGMIMQPLPIYSQKVSWLFAEMLTATNLELESQSCTVYTHSVSFAEQESVEEFFQSYWNFLAAMTRLRRSQRTCRSQTFHWLVVQSMAADRLCTF